MISTECRLLKVKETDIQNKFTTRAKLIILTYLKSSVFAVER